MRAHKKFDGSTGLLDLTFIFIFRVTDLRSGDKDGDLEGTLFQSNGKTLCKSLQDCLCVTSAPFIYKANWKR